MLDKWEVHLYIIVLSPTLCPSVDTNNNVDVRLDNVDNQRCL